jgi:hypothetical protein
MCNKLVFRIENPRHMEVATTCADPTRRQPTCIHRFDSSAQKERKRFDANADSKQIFRVRGRLPRQIQVGSRPK